MKLNNKRHAYAPLRDLPYQIKKAKVKLNMRTFGHAHTSSRR